MSTVKEMFTPKWVKWRVYHSKAEAEEIQAVFEREHIRYKLSAYTRESRTLSSAHQFTNNREAKAAMRNAWMGDSGLETYTFELHKDDVEKATELIRTESSSPREGSGYNSPYKRFSD